MRVPLTILCVILVFSACKKDSEPEVARKFLSFDMDSMIVVAENPNAIVSVANLTDTDPNNDIDKLTITAKGAESEEVTIILLGSAEGLAKGSFYSQDGNSLAVYYPKVALSQIANQNYGTFTLTITNVKDSLIEASFTGRLIDTTGAIPAREAAFGYLRAIVKSN